MYNLYCYTILKSMLMKYSNIILHYIWSILYYVILSCALMHYIVHGTLLDNMHCTIVCFIVYYTIMYYATQYFTGIHIDVLWNTVINGISIYCTLDCCTVLYYAFLLCVIMDLGTFNCTVLINILLSDYQKYSKIQFT